MDLCMSCLPVHNARRHLTLFAVPRLYYRIVMEAVAFCCCIIKEKFTILIILYVEAHRTYILNSHSVEEKKNHVVLDARGCNAAATAGGYSVRYRVSKRRRLRCGKCNLALCMFELMFVSVNTVETMPLRMRSMCARGRTIIFLKQKKRQC